MPKQFRGDTSLLSRVQLGKKPSGEGGPNSSGGWRRGLFSQFYKGEKSIQEEFRGNQRNPAGGRGGWGESKL